MLPAHTYAAKSAASTQTATEASKSEAADYEIVNDATLDILSKTSVSLARAGVDIIAPSDMMDGRVAAIRYCARCGRLHQHSYPFLCGEICLRILRTVFAKPRIQRPSLAIAAPIKWMEANLRQAMREIELDIQEGADMIMVKPAMPYLDVIAAGPREVLIFLWPLIRSLANTP